MKRFIITTIFILAYLVSFSQFYGDIAYKDGFDKADGLPEFWSQSNSVVGSSVLWTTGNPTTNQFSNIDPLSTHSALFSMTRDNKADLSLTTKELDMTGKSEIAVGFYGQGITSIREWNDITFTLRVSNNNGQTWTNLFTANDNAYDGIDIKGWKYYQYFIPSEFNNQKIKFQFYINASEYSGYGETVWIDGFFVSERYKLDAVIDTIGYSIKDNIPTKGALTSSEPVKVKFSNAGKTPINTVDLFYSINGGAAVKETYNLQTPLTLGQKLEYTFNAKANLSECQKNFLIKAWVNLSGDINKKNDSILGYAQNIMTDVPYTPRFTYTEGGTSYLSEDEWITKEIAANGGKWKITTAFNKAYWYIENKNATVDCDAYLITRPVKIEKDKTYTMSFDVYTDTKSTDPSVYNKMKIWFSPNADLSNKVELWSNNSIDATNGMSNFVRYKATANGAGYFVFECLSSKNAAPINLSNLYIEEVKAVDAGVTYITSPLVKKYMYENNETVSVKIRNYGLNNITSGSLKVNMSHNKGTIITETVSQQIPAGSEITHTFAKKIDPSDVQIKQYIDIWTNLSGDLNIHNDTISKELISTVTGIPYIPYFGDRLNLKEEYLFWEIQDVNNDGKLFTLAMNKALTGYAFVYGGSSSYPMTNIPQSNEKLFSRPMKLSAGKFYKVSYSTMVDRAGSSMPLKIELFKIEGETKTPVSTLFEGPVDYADLKTFEVKTSVQQDGIYEVGFSVINNNTINFKIYIQDFKMTDMLDIDLVLNDLLLPAKQISCYNTFPVGVRVKNDGINIINSFKLKIESASTGNKEQTFNIPIQSGETNVFYFDDDISFTNTGSENIKLSVEVQNDGNISNNSAEATITYVDNLQVPYTCMLNNFPEDILVVNSNKDKYMFEKVQYSSGMTRVYGYAYSGNLSVEADDILATRCISLANDKIYNINFPYKVANANDTASFEIYAYDASKNIRVEIADLKKVVSLKGQFDGYFTVPTNGNYSICFRVYGKTPSLQIYNQLNIEESPIKPDMIVTSIDSPSADAVFSDNETITVSFKNAGTEALSTIPFVCQIGETFYYKVYEMSINPEQTAIVDFTNVDLYTPGEYDIKVSIKNGADATPDNNNKTLHIKSLPIIDAMMVSLDKPKSGALKSNQEVIITIKNNGKGNLENIPVKCIVTDAVKGTKSEITDIISGPVADGETLQFTFTSTVNMYDEKTYNINVSTNMINDINTTNDAISTSVVCTQEPFDAGVIAIKTPMDGLLTAAEIVTITIKNYSTVDLFDIPVEVKTAEQTITGIIPQIKTGQNADYTFESKLDMSKFGDYEIIASTKIEDDANPSNDSFSKTVRSWKVDVGVTEIISPESGENMGTEAITIKVKNFGDVAVSEIPVRYIVGTMPQLGKITGELQPNATVEFTFPAKYDFSSAKTYTIKANTDLSTDVDKTNDTIKKIVVNTVNKIDAGINSIISPVTSEDLTASESLTVNIENFGETILSKIPIECDFDGEIVKEVIEGPLGVGKKMNYTFDKKFDMSAIKLYNVVVTLKVTGDKNKANDKIESVIEHTVGIENLDRSSLSIYPNPATEYINVSVEAAIITNIMIYDLDGKLVSQFDNISTSTYKVPVDKLNGLYIIKISTSKGNIDSKISIK